VACQLPLNLADQAEFADVADGALWMYRSFHE
jgi:hypothetical protein